MGTPLHRGGRAAGGQLLNVCVHIGLVTGMCSCSRCVWNSPTCRLTPHVTSCLGSVRSGHTANGTCLSRCCGHGHQVRPPDDGGFDGRTSVLGGGRATPGGAGAAAAPGPGPRQQQQHEEEEGGLPFPELEDVELELELQVRTAGGLSGSHGTGRRQGEVGPWWTGWSMGTTGRERCVWYGCPSSKMGGRTMHVHVSAKCIAVVRTTS